MPLLTKGLSPQLPGYPSYNEQISPEESCDRDDVVVHDDVVKALAELANFRHGHDVQHGFAPTPLAVELPLLGRYSQHS